MMQAALALPGYPFKNMFFMQIAQKLGHLFLVHKIWRRQTSRIFCILKI